MGTPDPRREQSKPAPLPLLFPAGHKKDRSAGGDASSAAEAAGWWTRSPDFYDQDWLLEHLFYGHGCGPGGDLLRWVELAEHRLRESLAYWQQPIALAAESECVVRAGEE